MNENTKQGFVYLIGAGPGDPGLITVKGLECLQKADYILYDGLVNPLLLRHTAAHAERTCRSEGNKGKWLNQDEINTHLIREAQAGKVVVRLKGGDPYIFGRGSEEAAALSKENIPFEVVPGITAATAAAVYAGISLTHRDFASAVAYVTGHEDPLKDESSLDYESLAHFPGTLVFYMGLHRLPTISQKLIAAGMPEATPACVVRRATWTDQESVYTTLSELPEAVKKAGLKAPSLIIVGDCVQQREQIDWYQERPLLGNRIGITRPKICSADGEMSRHHIGLNHVIDSCWNMGAEPVLIPTMEISAASPTEADQQKYDSLNNYDWLIFTSANGVNFFWDRLWESGQDLRAIARCKIASIGPATSAALEKLNLRADLVPDDFRAEALAEALKPQVEGQRLLWVRANRGRDVLPNELSPACAAFEELVVYQHKDLTNWNAEICKQVSNGQLDWIGLSSPAIARNLKTLIETHPELQDSFANVRFASLSPVTSQAAAELDMPISTEADDFTWDSLLQAICNQGQKENL